MKRKGGRERKKGEKEEEKGDKGVLHSVTLDHQIFHQGFGSISCVSESP